MMLPLYVYALVVALVHTRALSTKFVKVSEIGVQSCASANGKINNKQVFQGEK